MTSVIEAPAAQQSASFSHDGSNVEVSLVYLTPELAREFLDNNHPLNRDIIPSKVKVLVQNIEMSKFLLTGDAIKKDSLGRMIDGQYRCSAVVEAGIGVWTFVVQGLDPDVINVLGQETSRDVQDILKMSDRHVKFVNECVAVQGMLIYGTPSLRQYAGNRSKTADMVWENRFTLQYWAEWASKLYSASDLYISPTHAYANRSTTKRAISKSPLATLALFMSQTGADDEDDGLMEEFFLGVVTGVASDARTRNVITAMRRYLSATSPLVRIGGGNGSVNMFRTFDTVIRTYNKWALGETFSRIQPRRNLDDIHSLNEVTMPVKVRKNDSATPSLI